LLLGYAPRVHEGERVEKHTVASAGTNGQPRGFMWSAGWSYSTFS